MSSLNQVNLIGNLGADPEIRSMGSGDKVANMRLACSEKWKDKNSGERREKTEWVSIAVFGPLVNVIEQYVKKGSKLYVSGKMQTRKWQDQSGADRYSTEVVLQGPQATLVMLDSAGGGSGGSGGSYDSGGGGVTVGSGAPPTDDDEESIPF